MNCTSLLEDTLGTSGSGKPIIVRAEIKGKRRSTKRKIRKAVNNALSKRQLPSFDDLNGLTGAEMIKTKLYRNKNRRVWIRIFQLNVG